MNSHLNKFIPKWLKKESKGVCLTLSDAEEGTVWPKFLKQNFWYGISTLFFLNNCFLLFLIKIAYFL